MKIYLTNFESNNSSLQFEDVIFNIKCGVKNGVQVVRLQSKDEHLFINASGSSYSDEGETSGHLISISPMIYDENWDYYEWYDPKYFDHPNFWIAHLVVPFACPDHEEDMYHEIIMDNKNNYTISFVPDYLAFPFESLEKAELISEMNSDKKQKAQKIWNAWENGKVIQFKTMFFNLVDGSTFFDWKDRNPSSCPIETQPQSCPEIWRVKPNN